MAEFVRDCLTIEFFKAMFTELGSDEGPSPQEILASTETKIEEEMAALAEKEEEEREQQEDTDDDNNSETGSFAAARRASKRERRGSIGSFSFTNGPAKEPAFWEIEPTKKKDVDADPAVALKLAFEVSQQKLSQALGIEAKFSGTTGTGE